MGCCVSAPAVEEAPPGKGAAGAAGAVSGKDGGKGGSREDGARSSEAASNGGGTGASQEWGAGAAEGAARPGGQNGGGESTRGSESGAGAGAVNEGDGRIVGARAACGTPAALVPPGAPAGEDVGAHVSSTSPMQLFFDSMTDAFEIDSQILDDVERDWAQRESEQAAARDGTQIWEKIEICQTLNAATKDDGSGVSSWGQSREPRFRLRGKRYMTDRAKYVAPNVSLYKCIGADIYRGSRRLLHVARGLKLPPAPERPKHPLLKDLPPFLILCWMFPDGQATLFGKQSPSTPSGMIIQYMQLDEEVAMQYVQSGMVGLLNALAKDPPPGSSMPNMRTDMRDRLKAVPRLFNPSGVKKMFSLPEWRLISSYNGKPVLTRPQHKFFRGENYLEINIDLYEFAYLARKALEMFRTRVSKVTVDIAFTLEGRNEKELPEILLGSTRLSKVDYFQAPYFPEHLLDDDADKVRSKAKRGRART
eukprot:PRCOL_00001298-RA